ncbi:TM1812 family CRISPR-associated protein [Pyrodictium abyssi]|uniref:Uncharacterized protein n=1 Tax=Pyrodictium abyssi TaxID=54256 RepID=A0ABN6ZSV0_9CREN|nr:hypothetical protein PABY_12350 [Pyrodictium abyssi]
MTRGEDVRGDKVLVVAFVGDPCGWSRVDYKPTKAPAKGKCNWFDVESIGESATSATTLKPLLASGARAAVYVPISVAFGMAGSRARNECCLGVDETDDCSLDRLGHIKAMAACAQRRLEAFLACELGDTSRVKVMVTPSVGRYRRGDGKAAAVFRGDAGLYYAYVLVTLYQMLLYYRPETLVVDTTHGINYATTMGLQATQRAAEAYAAATGSDLRVIVVNSEPVAGEEPQEGVSIYATLCRYIEPSDAVYSLASLKPPGRIYQPRAIEGEARQPPREVQERLKSIVHATRRVFAAVRALAAGLPLLGLHLYSEIENSQLDDIEQALGLVLDLVELASEVKRLGETFEVAYQYSLDPIDVDSLVAAHALSKALRELLGEAHRRQARHGRAIFYRLDDLEKIVEKLRGGLLGEQSYYIAMNEVSDMKVRLQAYDQVIGMSKDNPQLYAKVYAVAEGNLRAAFQADRVSCNTGERVFYAHAGLVKELLYVVKLDDDAYAVAYRPECFNNIERKIVAQLEKKR